MPRRPKLDKADSDDLDWALGTLHARRDRYKLTRRYYDGDHRLLFASDRFLNAFGALFSAFADNLCEAVVDAHADRLQIAALDMGADDLNDAATALWESNRMERRSGEVHTESFCQGDGYLIVWTNAAGRVRLWPQLADQVCVAYDPEEPDRIVKAAKVWADRVGDGRWRWRANLYYPDRIARYGTGEVTSTDWPKPELFAAVEDGLGGRIENRTGRVPVFHFGNNARTGQPGRSELAPVIPLQDALNKSIADMLVGMEFVALPQRWMTGVEVPIDPETGEATRKPFQPGVERIWSLPDPNAKIGQFDAADLTMFLKVSDGFRAEIARVSGIPAHHLLLTTGEAPSGESLKTSEGRFVRKLGDRQSGFGETWGEAVAFGVALETGSSTIGDCEVAWESAESRNELVETEVVERKLRIGLSSAQGLRELGYDDEQIAQIVEERAREQAAAGAAALAAFDRGAPVTDGQGASIMAGSGEQGGGAGA